jgi:hypothetical protein
MKRLAILLLLYSVWLAAQQTINASFPISASGGSPIALIAHTSKIVTGSGNSGTSSAINTTGASLLVIQAISYTGPAEMCTAGNVTDSKSNTWNLVQVYTWNGDRPICFWYAANPTVGSGHTFTVSNSGFSAFFPSAWSNVKTTSPLDVQTGGSCYPSTCTTVSTGSVTPTVNDDVCIGGGNGYFGEDTSWSLASPAQGMTTLDTVLSVGGSNTGGIDGYSVQTTATAISSTATPAGSSVSAGEMTATIACFFHQ